MTLFSWFIDTKKNNIMTKNNNHLGQALSTFNNNTMWPTAKVRNNIGTQPQTYITSKSHIKKDILKERTT